MAETETPFERIQILELMLRIGTSFTRKYELVSNEISRYDDSITEIQRRKQACVEELERLEREIIAEYRTKYDPRRPDVPKKEGTA